LVARASGWHNAGFSRCGNGHLCKHLSCACDNSWSANDLLVMDGLALSGCRHPLPQLLAPLPRTRLARTVKEGGGVGGKPDICYLIVKETMESLGTTTIQLLLLGIMKSDSVLLSMKY